MDENYLNILIKKLWDGCATKQECVALLAYLENSEQEGKELLSTEHWISELGDLQVDLLQATGKLSLERREALLKQIERKMGSMQQPKVVYLYRRRLKIAVVSAAIIAITFVAYFMFEKINTHYNLDPAQMEMAQARIFDTISNSGAQSKTIYLSDRSTILLYPDSKIWFKHGAMDSAVALAGKAYFKIRHNELRVFTVTTGDIMTTDIGTEFEIDAHRQNKTAIRLVKGKVKVGISANSKLQMQEQYLNRGDLLSISIKDQKVELNKISTLYRAKKVNEPLVFNRTPLEKVFRKISVKYNVTIHCDLKDVSQFTFTGNVEPNDSLMNILNIICSINNLSLSKDNTGFIIKKN